MNISDTLTRTMSTHTIFNITVFGYNIPITDTIIVMWLVMAFLIIASYIFTRRLETIPKGKQNVAEIIVENVNSFCRDNLGHHWKSFAPYIGTIILFLAVANSISVFDIIPNGEELFKITHLEFFKNLPDFGIRPPTKDINVPVCMAIISIIITIAAGIRFKKLDWFKSFGRPSVAILPFNILDYLARPVSLSFRLFGNILAAFVIMQLIYYVEPILIPAAFSMYFDLFDGVLQGYIFVFLTTIYIGEAIE